MADPADVRMWDLAQERYVPAVTGRGVRMDVEKARGVVRELASLADAVVEAQQDLQFVTVVPPAADDVSVNIALQSMRMVFAGRAFLASWHDDVRTAIAALTEQISSYEDADRLNARRA
jgi:hypothetical protein